jgi:hypothetical protein
MIGTLKNSDLDDWHRLSFVPLRLCVKSNHGFSRINTDGWDADLDDWHRLSFVPLFLCAFA